MKYFFVILSVLISSSVYSEEAITITSWNIEHLGSDGRGFGGGFGAGNLPMRTETQLKQIGDFIKDTLKSDLVALQEITNTHSKDGNTSKQLGIITKQMGPDWKYWIPPKTDEHDGDSMYCGFIWNRKKLKRKYCRPLNFPNISLAGKNLFDRQPVIALFESATPDKGDFLIVNVHLASGQDNDENHLIAMTAIEHSLSQQLRYFGDSERDRIILGDFNDNPFAEKRTQALYQHMAFKGYTNLVTKDSGATRMNDFLTSTIDHVLLNEEAKNDLIPDSFKIYRPVQQSEYAAFRFTYSDHFPLSFKLDISKADDDVDDN